MTKKKLTKTAKKSYSPFEKRLHPHASCDYLTPAKAHSMKGVLNKRWSINNTKKVIFTNAN
jgi:hypothetical protein